MNKIKLGNFLADLRNEKGLTQEQLAEMINVNYKTISKWECGNSTPSLETLTELSEIFEVSLYELSNCERINNPFISKENIKKVINKDNIKRFFIIKLIALIISLILLVFITYSCIYTINNYNQFQVYELVSEDEDLHIDGLYIETPNRNYIIINYINYITNNGKFTNDIVNSLKYSLTTNNSEEIITNVKLENNKLLKESLKTIQIFHQFKPLISECSSLTFTIKYENANNNTIEKEFKLLLSKKKANNKLFY